MKYILAIIIALFLLACAPVALEKTSETAPAPIEPKVIKPAPAPTFEPVVETTPTVVEEPPLPKDIAYIVEKGLAVTSYQYEFDNSKPDTYEVYLRDTKFRKVYRDTMRFKEGVYYNEVYVNPSQKQAVGVCTKLGTTCGPIWNKAFKVSYEKEGELLTPQDVLRLIRPDVKKVGDQLFDNQRTLILQYINAQGKKERVWVDAYNNLPLKQEIFASGDPEEESIKEVHTFTRAIIGVRKSDVTLPENFQLS
ncbi:hypothetical protein HYX14_06040 [Candidatus Woesearchaeota archaeon]|nr:hypothetical protein [Candidatus Woesearchaeota archaeon]